MDKQNNAYATLQLRKGCTDEQIKEAYLTLVKRFDPERHTDRFMIIQNAFERLTDPVRRAHEDILTYNAVRGRLMFTDEEKAEVPEADVETKISTLEASANGNGNDDLFEQLAFALMQLSACHVRRKRLREAIGIWERVLQIDPTHQRAKNNLIFGLSYLALSYAEHELFDEAVPLWVRASQMNPDDDAILHNLALACEGSGNTAEAERYWGETLRRWKRTLEKNPDDQYLKNCILEVHRLHGGRAIDRASSAPATDGTVVAEPKQQVQRAVQEYKEILKINPDDFDAQFQIAGGQMEQGQWKEAVETLKGLMRKFPKNVEVLNLLGWALLNSGQIDAAFLIWRESLKIDAKNNEAKNNILRAHLELGKRCREQGQHNSALKHFKSLLKILGMQNPEVHFEIGSTYYLKGDRRSAYVEFQYVLKLDPKNQNARRMLQELRMR